VGSKKIPQRITLRRERDQTTKKGIGMTEGECDSLRDGKKVKWECRVGAITRKGRRGLGRKTFVLNRTELFLRKDASILRRKGGRTRKKRGKTTKEGEAKQSEVWGKRFLAEMKGASNLGRGRELEGRHNREARRRGNILGGISPKEGRLRGRG